MTSRRSTAKHRSHPLATTRESKLDERVGRRLVANGKLSEAELGQVQDWQRREGLGMDEALHRLKRVHPAEIDRALAKEFGYPYLEPHETQLGAELVTAYQPLSTPAEALRAVRSQVVIRGLEAGHTAICVTSAARGEGRSYLAANLAVALVQLGKRTLLVDADLRFPRQHRIFHLSGEAGLVSILKGWVDEEWVEPIDSLPGLAVLPAGPRPPNPSELLSSDVFDAFVRSARERYDAVILDSPAGALCSDALNVAHHCRAALLVARRHRTALVDATTLVRQLADAGVTLIGCTLNNH